MTNKLQSDYGKNNNFAAVLRNNNENVAKNLHVANLCIVKQILTAFNGTYGEARIERLCLGDNEIGHSGVGYFFYDSPAVGDLVLSVVTDTDFRDIIKKSPIKPMNVKPSSWHSEAFGIILKLN